MITAMRPWAALVLVVLFAATSRGAPATAEAIESLAAANDWPAVLRETSRAVVLRGKVAEGYDRSRMYELRAEAQLRTNQFKPAADSFKSAAAEPGVPEARADACLAAARLMPRTDARGYDPPLRRGEGSTPPIEVLTDAGRRRAAAACLAAELDDLNGRLEKAEGVRAVRVATACVREIDALRPVERFAHGETTRCDAGFARVIERVDAAMAAFVVESRLSLDARAGTTTQPVATTQPAATVEAVAQSCVKLSADFAKLGDALGGEVPAQLARHTDDVQRIYDRTKRMRVITMPGEGQAQ
jgi:hypothetical protein